MVPRLEIAKVLALLVLALSQNVTGTLFRKANLKNTLSLQERLPNALAGRLGDQEACTGLGSRHGPACFVGPELNCWAILTCRYLLSIPLAPRFKLGQDAWSDRWVSEPRRAQAFSPSTN